MNEVIVKDNVKVREMVYELNGIQIMIDSDLAKLYGCKNGTKEINQAVKNNPSKFPKRYSWKLSKEEFFELRSKFLTTNRFNMSRSTPRVFTEQGVAMLATILKTPTAIDATIAILDTFVAMRHYISNNLIEQKYVNELVFNDSKRIDLIEETLSGFKEKNTHLFFDGQIYNAYSFLIDIFNKSKNEIIIIDNYIDKNILDVLARTKRKIILVTNKYNNQDYNKYIRQYKNVTLKITNRIHDRFIILDRKTLYNSGASFKDLGKKCFAINKVEDDEILNNLLNRYIDILK